MQCYICTEGGDPPDSLVHLACGHTWCKGCLNETVMFGLRQRTAWPPFCCKTEGVDLDSVRSSLDTNLVDLLDLIREELDCNNPIYCHVPQCSKFIPVDTGSDQGQFVRCPKCHEFTCVECKAGKHKHVKSGECPDLISKEDKELAEKEGWKQCPNKRCQKLIELAGGCRLMECECGVAFCFECGHMLDLEDMQCPCSRPRHGGAGAAQTR